MIHIKATVRGEPDASPIIHIFQYVDKSDEQVLCNSIEIIKKKLDGNIKINVNESLMLYCYFITNQIRICKRQNEQIEKSASSLLSADKVLMGVQESLRKISFDIIIDNLPRRYLVFEEPITSWNYAPGSKTGKNKHL